MQENQAVHFKELSVTGEAQSKPEIHQEDDNHNKNTMVLAPNSHTQCLYRAQCAQHSKRPYTIDTRLFWHYRRHLQLPQNYRA